MTVDCFSKEKQSLIDLPWKNCKLYCRNIDILYLLGSIDIVSDGLLFNLLVLDGTKFQIIYLLCERCCSTSMWIEIVLIFDISTQFSPKMRMKTFNL